MTRMSDFSKIEGVALIEWHLKTVTPLCIKSGTTSSWRQAPVRAERVSKMRMVGAAFDFFQKDAKEGKISDFYYDVYVDEPDSLRIRYRIPSSSVRGALRNYTIKRLVNRKYWSAAMTPAVDDSVPSDQKRNSQREYSLKLIEALKDPGWRLLQNLFGLATDSSEKALEEESVAGRLHVAVGDLKPLTKSELDNIFEAEGFDVKLVKPGSEYGRMCFTTRNPIDRITHGAKEGGLHSFTELAPGNEFKVTLSILNPTPPDLGFVTLWEQAIIQGILRVGGLTSVGRGKLELLPSSNIRLFLISKNEFSNLRCEKKFSKDILSGIFHEYVISEWDSAARDYLTKLNELHDFYRREAANG